MYITSASVGNVRVALVALVAQADVRVRFVRVRARGGVLAIAVLTEARRRGAIGSVARRVVEDPPVEHRR